MSFANYSNALDPAEIENPEGASRVPDTGGDSLPFDHLENRRFEILAYRLQCAEHDDRTKRVRLMQGTGERGRDIIIYDAAGRLETIGQCKKYRDRVDRPMLIRELLKLAFHALIDPTIIGTGVLNYELWAPGGLTEPAAKLVDTWPAEWTAQLLEPEVGKVLHEYAAFDELRWETAKEFVATFSKHLRVRHLDGLAISTLVRKHVAIYAAFFQGNVVMKKEDVKDSLEDIVRRTMSEQVRYANDGDARHVLDRITSFGADERHVSNCALVMGLKPELLSRLRRGEYERFAKHLIEGLFGLIQVVTDAGARIQGDIVREFRERAPGSRSLPAVLGQILTLSMTSRIATLVWPGLKLQPSAVAYNKLSLDDRFQVEVRRLWGSFEKCLSRYDPAKHAPGSDEEFRARIAALALEGIATEEQFNAQVRADYLAHRQDVERIYNDWMNLVPTQIMIVADTVSIFESEWLFKRMVDGVERLTSLRGSAVIPE